MPTKRSVSPAKPNGIITILTDFGLSDTYVGAVKGAILAVAPHATIVDLTHQVPPQDIHTGAFLLSTAWNTYPPGTVHLVVVDPGVGTKRKPLLLTGQGHYFVGPDNGLFTHILYPNLMAEQPRTKLFAPFVSVPPEGFRAFVLDESHYWRSEISTTFHARDIFGPIAAHLASGVRPEALGTPMQRVTTLHIPKPKPVPQGLQGYVLHVDTYGNLFTNIHAKDLRGKQVQAILLAGKTIQGMSATYGVAKGLAAVLDSQGLLEIALPNGNAARALKAGKGTPVTVRF